MGITKQYKGVLKGLGQYWSAYGKLAALISSPFLHSAALLTMLCFPLWWAKDWWDKSLSILPSVLGFSIAGFALLLGVGNDRFRSLLGVKREGRNHSTLSKTSAGFFHFVLIQALALAVALIASGRPLSVMLAALDASELLGAKILHITAKLFRFTGFFLLCYSLMTALAATLSIFRLATVFSGFATREESKKNLSAAKAPE